jgi:uncharacterized protein
MSLTDNYIFDLDENVTRESVSYKNRFGITIAADFYRPKAKDFDESEKHPAIIVGAPYGGVKEQGPGHLCPEHGPARLRRAHLRPVVQRLQRR